MKSIGVFAVIVGTGLVWMGTPYAILGLSAVILGLAFLLGAFDARTHIPAKYCGLPMAVSKNGYSIYSASDVYSTWPAVILDDRTMVVFSPLGIEVSRGNGPIYILNRKGKLVFPGKK
ncbi:TPA: hypothetical protein DCZ81_00155 [Candidatus Collierbacteria bacterium]|nr:hypothetical protein [Candidatus Collierbacteria bacterium]HCX26045.1 hypothetical protein [Candidatus Collierbacteria bacterium]